MESIEASGKSVDEAVQQALVRLGKRREEVEVSVLQEPSRGTFGIGSKDARVLVTVRQGSKGAVITPEMADAILGPDVPDVVISEDEEYDEDEEFEDEDELEDDEEEFEDEEDEEGEEDEEFEDDEPVPFIASNAPVEPSLILEQANVAQISTGELQDVETPSREDIEITVDVLQHILRYMNIHATVQVRSTEPLTLNIHGINENLGLLIGRRGETLAALQLLVSLIVSHRTRHRMRIIVDAENYRERREENLRSLALRVAQQVRNYRRSIALEAMPPHERRIVHIALADSKDISTESIGEGEERRVVISLKRPGR
ncbi:MAG TPA: RNA-binding cell elongation regulator Jag/EloR [Ktedonobacteraceae bacterium]|nr:RNA-binding cell elongation regulator Jag/EloR [Ktedonobacteraceae bacterium]HEV2660874.1 RNA-binding cell elongation regulator Jag/EloR [Ktedonobacteraceae bacterium]